MAFELERNSHAPADCISMCLDPFSTARPYPLNFLRYSNFFFIHLRDKNPFVCRREEEMKLSQNTNFACSGLKYIFCFFSTVAWIGLLRNHRPTFSPGDQLLRGRAACACLSCSANSKGKSDPMSNKLATKFIKKPPSAIIAACSIHNTMRPRHLASAICCSGYSFVLMHMHTPAAIKLDHNCTYWSSLKRCRPHAVPRLHSVWTLRVGWAVIFLCCIEYLPVEVGAKANGRMNEYHICY